MGFGSSCAPCSACTPLFRLINTRNRAKNGNQELMSFSQKSVKTHRMAKENCEKDKKSKNGPLLYDKSNVDSRGGQPIVFCKSDIR